MPPARWDFFPERPSFSPHSLPLYIEAAAVVKRSKCHSSRGAVVNECETCEAGALRSSRSCL